MNFLLSIRWLIFLSIEWEIIVDMNVCRILLLFTHKLQFSTFIIFQINRINLFILVEISLFIEEKNKHSHDE